MQYVINNAGVYGRRNGLDDVTSDDMLFAFQTNTIGPLLVVQQLRKHGMIGKPSGETVVANLTSKVGSMSSTI